MSDTGELIKWKTDAWKDPGMVAWYAKRMVENTSTNMLKNQLEMNLIARFAVGQDVLDVGIGTGRGSVPLAKKGMNVTGIDSSQAMLDETRRQAGDSPMTLKVGDVRDLPVPDTAFDFLISLNVMVHFPHWQEVLLEWKRVMRPGGRIMFDIHSLDHQEAVYGKTEYARKLAEIAQNPQEFGNFMSMARVEDLVAWAGQHDMHVVDIVPVGAFLGGGAINHWLREELEDKFWWRRLLTWISSDPALFDCALFLEEEITSRLTSRATCRFMIVLENSANPAANSNWLEENARRNSLLAGDFDEKALSQLLPLNLPDFQTRLAGHLARERNRLFTYSLLNTIQNKKPGWDLMSFLPATIGDLFRNWQRQDSIDEHAMAIAQTWQGSPFADKFTHQGVSIAAGMEYFLMEKLLTAYFKVFSGVRS